MNCAPTILVVQYRLLFVPESHLCTHTLHAHTYLYPHVSPHNSQKQAAANSRLGPIFEGKDVAAAAAVDPAAGKKS